MHKALFEFVLKAHADLTIYAHVVVIYLMCSMKNLVLENKYQKCIFQFHFSPLEQTKKRSTKLPKIPKTCNRREEKRKKIDKKMFVF